MNKKGYIEGVFGKKRNYFKILTPRKENNRYFILFHGSFSSSYNSEKDEIIAKLIIKENLGNVILYETSRDTYTFESKLSFEEYKSSFGPKTFRQELQDVKILFNFFWKKIIMQKKDFQLIFVGFSLGGTLSSYFLPIYGRKVKQVFLFNSGVTTKVKGSTYSHYPNKKEILANFITYKGEIILVQGRGDTVVPQEEATQILDIAKETTSTELICLKGIDHSFRKIDGIPAISQIARKIFEILRRRS